MKAGGVVREGRFIGDSNNLYGFIAEKGNFGYDFEKEDITSHFVITAVLVESQNLDCLENEIEKLSGSFFDIDESEQTNINKIHEKRLELLNSIKDYNFKVFTVVVNKKKIIQSSGLGYKQSFKKFLNSILYNELHNYFPKLQLIADEHENESKEFLEAFKRYIIQNHVPNLFGEYEFGFANRRSEVLIQLANFICGTIAIGYESNEYENEHKAYMDILEKKLLPIVFWPQELEDYVKKLDQYKGGTFDKNIAYNSIKLARKYIESNKSSREPEIYERICVLRYLLSMMISKRSNEYASSKDIINNLFEITGREYSSHYFKTKIIAKLRDAGILISSTKSGYKLPIREKEILAFVNQTSSMIRPMLQRLKICRNRVLSATGNELDVLQFKEYEYLKTFFEKENN